MILALLLVAVEMIPVSYGLDPATGREMAYLWDDKGIIVTAEGGLWAEQRGEGIFRLPEGRTIRRVWRFAATDVGSCMEGDLDLSRGGVVVVPHAPHNRGLQPYDGWSVQEQDYPTSGAELFRVKWVCRATCGSRARCHFGVRVELKKD